MQGQKQNGSTQIPLALEVEFKVLCARNIAGGTGRTVLMSSKEIVFKTDRLMPPGTHLELAVAWPVLLENRVALQLIIDSRVLRVHDGAITALICKYQFRTRSKANSRAVSHQMVAFPRSEQMVRGWTSGGELHA